MPAITRSKLSPLLVVAALFIVGTIVYVKARSPAPAAVKAGAQMTSVPSPLGADAPDNKPGMLGLGARSASGVQRSADADSPGETLKTVTASNNELRVQVQRALEDNQQLRQENSSLKSDKATIETEVRNDVLAQLRSQPLAGTTSGAGSWNATPTVPGGPGATAVDGAPTSDVAAASGNGLSSHHRPTALGEVMDAAADGGSRMIDSLGSSATAQRVRSDIPGGLGFDGGGAATGVAQDRGQGGAGRSATAGSDASVRILPVGYHEAADANGHKSLVRSNGMPIAGGAPGAGPSAGAQGNLNGDLAQGENSEATSKHKAPKPFYTIPENATLPEVTMMTALVGRIPIDGHVQDPMPFKLIVGRNNLAANGQYVPDEISGMIVSGIAIGDMALSCSEGFVQSVTFVFTDGAIQTVSLRKGGVGGGLGGGLGGGQSSIGQVNKLAWLSDEFGNPCIAGKFVTNAPAYLTDIVGLKTLSIAAQASALAQTSSSVSPLGSTSSVTGSKGSYIMGQAAGSGVDEVSNWITKRLNNSFDAVISPAGGRVVLHIEQEIAIDKAHDARLLDYAQAQRGNARRGRLD